MGLIFFFFLFENPLQIYQTNMMKWIPVLACILGMLLSGRFNEETPTKLLPLLFLPFIIFKIFNYAYFPFILVLIAVGILALVITRKNLKSNYRLFASILLAGIFSYSLVSQPLIIANEGFGYDDNGEIINATIIWDFSEKKELSLPDHLLIDENNIDYNLNTIKGKTHFVTFWATWCAPCIAEKPMLDKLKAEYSNNPNIEFIDISFDHDNVKWKKYISEKSPEGLQLISKSQAETSRALNFAGIPMHIIVDSEGVYQKHSSFEVAQKVFKKSLK